MVSLSSEVGQGLVQWLSSLLWAFLLVPDPKLARPCDPSQRPLCGTSLLAGVTKGLQGQPKYLARPHHKLKGGLWAELNGKGCA